MGITFSFKEGGFARISVPGPRWGLCLRFHNRLTLCGGQVAVSDVWPSPINITKASTHR